MLLILMMLFIVQGHICGLMASIISGKSKIQTYIDDVITPWLVSYSILSLSVIHVI